MTRAIAHRGATLLAPENTLAAFRAAAAGGAEAVELDVHLSRDGHLVVMHDDTVDRTTDGTGALAGLTLAEIRRLDAGSWFAPEFTGERVPVLSEVLQLPVHLVIELKHGSERYPGIERQLVTQLQAAGRLEDTIVISGSAAPLQELARLAPDLASLSFQTGTIEPGAAFPAADRAALSVLFAPPVPGLAPLVRESRDLGHQVLGTTLWVEGEWEPYLRAQVLAGLDGVFTDDVERLVQELERYKEH